ncbi:GNAT family N-acetyltransferase [Arthrobacter mangrovi]|uniref:N-acetyltransferase n=1 Tax=Arthrobacter mangrovi TaxID=2966350 RepID=A0ABQ5MQY1_9MICC|nr:GNAT family N-acetyltransferase [Arthrobacter mangrovi]GLB66399.1 N-acetyltransferase [Arthrobacter mangrovi]
MGAELRRAQQAELAARFGTPDHEAGPPPSDADVAVFLIAYERCSGQPLGCGGIRRLDAATGEVKRVYVLPYARGSEVASSILAVLEECATQLGYAELRAEAGSVQADGIRLYESAGYARVPNFGPYTDAVTSRCFAKAIGTRILAARAAS